MQEGLKYNNFKLLWLADMAMKIRLELSPEEASNDEIKAYLLDAYSKRYLPQGRFYNNITKSNEIATAEDFINKVLNSDYILTGYCCLYKNHDEINPIIIQAIASLLANRKINKKAMLKYDLGTSLYTFYDTRQRNFKVATNSVYGIESLDISPIFNSFNQNSITMSGQDIITTSICMIESFLSNSYKFSDYDDMLQFVKNCSAEKLSHNIDDYIDRDIEASELYDYLSGRFDCELTGDDIRDLKAMCERIPGHYRSVIYYKNNFAALMKNRYFVSKIKELTTEPYILEAANSEESERLKMMEPKYEEFRSIVCDLCEYHFIYDDRYTKAITRYRDTVKAVDTDSNFVYLDPLIETLSSYIGTSDDKIKFNILNLLIDICQEAEKVIYAVLTRNFGIPEKKRPIINMKNEFVYKTLLLTKGKKNYAGWVKSRLGKPVPGDDPDVHLDLKGLTIKKTSVAKSLRESASEFIVDKIMIPDKIRLLDVISAYDDIVAMIADSLRSGKTDFCLPKTCGAFTSYANIYSQDVVKATMIWNLLEPDHVIIPPTRVFILKLRCSKQTSSEFQAWKVKYPAKAALVEKCLFGAKDDEALCNIKKYGFSSVALPIDTEKIPEYLIPIINYDTMVSDNAKNLNVILNSLGIVCNDKDSSSSNILDI